MNHAPAQPFWAAKSMLPRMAELPRIVANREPVI